MSKKRGATFNRQDPLARFTIAQDQQRDISTAAHISLQAMLTGNGAETGWNTVACAINLALVLAEKGYSAGAIETIRLAQHALMRAWERAHAEKTKGRWALDGDGARLIMAVLNIHDEQVSRCTRGDIKAALDEVHRRIEQDEIFETGGAAANEEVMA